MELPDDEGRVWGQNIHWVRGRGQISVPDEDRLSRPVCRYAGSVMRTKLYVCNLTVVRWRMWYTS